MQNYKFWNFLILMSSIEYIMRINIAWYSLIDLNCRKHIPNTNYKYVNLLYSLPNAFSPHIFKLCASRKAFPLCSKVIVVYNIITRIILKYKRKSKWKCGNKILHNRSLTMLYNNISQNLRAEIIKTKVVSHLHAILWFICDLISS